MPIAIFYKNTAVPIWPPLPPPPPRATMDAAALVSSAHDQARRTLATYMDRHPRGLPQVAISPTRLSEVGGLRALARRLLRVVSAFGARCCRRSGARWVRAFSSVERVRWSRASRNGSRWVRWRRQSVSVLALRCKVFSISVSLSQAWAALLRHGGCRRGNCGGGDCCVVVVAVLLAVVVACVCVGSRSF